MRPVIVWWLPGTVSKPRQQSDKRLDEQAGGGRYHTNAGGMRGDADHSLVSTVSSGAVRERNDGKPEQPSESNPDQSCEAHRSQTCHHSDPPGLHA